MWKLYQLTAVATLALAFGGYAVSASARPGDAAMALLWQAAQYTHIKTIHLEASSRFTVTTVGGRRQVGNIRYSFWGAGSKYRIVFRQSIPQAKFDCIMADNGKHLYSLDRVTGELVIRQSHPTAGDELMDNPILEPLVPLAPPPPHHPAMWNLWVNFARFARDPKSVIDRCLAVRDCGRTNTAGTFHGCLLGSFKMVPARVKFTLRKGSWSHPLVTGWMASTLGKSGMNARLVHVIYRAFRLRSGRIIYLPVAFELVAMEPNYGPWKGPGISQTKVTQLVLNQPIPPGTFRISYKLASFVTVVKHGNSTTIQVKSKHQPPGWSK